MPMTIYISLNPEVLFRLYAVILKNQYDVITPPPIFRSLRNLEDRCQMTRRWLHIRQRRNLKWKSNMAAVRFPKPEVVHLGRELRYFIEIRSGNNFSTF